MKKITDHIAYLLTHYDCVIVPDLGGFIVRNEPAVILPHKILPPRKVVSFNAQLSHNDGFLASKCAQKFGMKYNQALVELRTFVDNLLITAKQGESIEIGTLGNLFVNMASQMEFAPRPLSSLPDNYGLSELRISRRTQQPTQITINIPQRKNFVRYAAACVFILLFCLLSPQTIDDNALVNYSSINPINWSEILLEQEKEREQMRQDSILAVLLAQEQAEKEQALIKKQSYKFHVIVAALGYDAAHRYCDKLLASNHTSARVIPYRNFYRVSIESFATRNQALEAMRILRRTTHKQAWVYCE